MSADHIYLTQQRDYYTLMKSLKDLRIPWQAENFLDI